MYMKLSDLTWAKNDPQPDATVRVISTDMRHKCLLSDQEIVHMITLGLDPHPGSHTVVALDPNGALWPGSRFSIRREGLSQLHQFAIHFSARRWRRLVGHGAHELLYLQKIRASLPHSLQAIAQRRIKINRSDQLLWAHGFPLLPCPADIIHMLLALAASQARFERRSAVPASHPVSEQRLVSRGFKHLG
jgi:hypothetical protein